MELVLDNYIDVLENRVKNLTNWGEQCILNQVIKDLEILKSDLLQGEISNLQKRLSKIKV